MSDQNKKSSPSLPPVTVIETIPVAGRHALTPEEVQKEQMPLPDNLIVYPELGRGGCGRIHPATDRNLLRHVALKRLDSRMAKEEFYRNGFIAEAQITGQLEHPNIVPVHELGIAANGVPFFTMKLIQGVDLARWMRSSRRPPGSTERLEEGLDIFVKVCDAVAYAHDRGVIHRDLKPENIMVAKFGQVYLMDWGLARLSKTRPASGEYSQMEAPGAVGTPDYMAPEQAEGDPSRMDERCDIFGLGAILYELVSGHRPWGDSRNGQELMRRAVLRQLIPVSHACAGLGVSRQLLQIIEKATHPDPTRRYQSVPELQQAVRHFLRGGLHLPMQAFAAGDTIIREGDAGNAAYLIVSGTCRAYRQVGTEQETLATMGEGTVFGEMALLLDEPRAASVEASTPVSVLVLDRKTIEEGLGTDGWTGALVRALAGRFRSLEEQFRATGLRHRT